MWYCHECHAEMRPLMIPDPACASCRGTFVEKIESGEDDPRSFQEAGPAFDDGDPHDDNTVDMFSNLMQLLASGPATPGGASSLPSQRSRSPPVSPIGHNLRFEINRTGPGGTARTVFVGGPNNLGRDRGDFPAGGGNIAGNLVAQYLLSMLAHRGGGDHEDMFGGMLGGNGAPENGRWGDYVFNQEALDQIITQLMENSNSSRPIPATDEIMEKLDRQVIEEGSPLLERECAVCKEQFSSTAEDPDEQVAVTLPCKHPFHEGCIIPWLKTSGTCPVCRHQLVPQPQHHSSPGSPPGNSNNGSTSSASQQGPSGNITSPTASGGGASGSRGNDNGGGGGGGIFNALFNIMGHGRSNSTSNNSPPSSSNAASRSPARNERRQSHDDVPGGWWD